MYGNLRRRFAYHLERVAVPSSHRLSKITNSTGWPLDIRRANTRPRRQPSSAKGARDVGQSCPVLVDGGPAWSCRRPVRLGGASQDVTVLALVVLFGAYSLVDGVVALAATFGPNAEGRRFWLALQGIAGILVGAITFIWPGVTTLVLLALISAWAVVTGVLQVLAAVRLRREIRGEWLLALGGVCRCSSGSRWWSGRHPARWHSWC